MNAETTQETNQQYHADLTHVGSSMLKLSGKSLRLYYDTFVAQTIPRERPTPAMVLGSLCHTFLIDPDTFDGIYWIAEGCKSRRGNAWAEAEAEAESRGQQCVLVSQVDAAHRMTEAVKAHQKAAALLAFPGPVEQSIRWTDTATGLKLKCKPDKCIEPDIGVRGIDIKSAIDPRWTADPNSPFSRQAWNLEYHCQFAHYSDGIDSEHDIRGSRFAVIVVGSEHPHDVYMGIVDAKLIAIGRRINQTRLEQLAKCHRTGVWQSPEQLELQTLEAPGWAS